VFGDEKLIKKFDINKWNEKMKAERIIMDIIYKLYNEYDTIELITVCMAYQLPLCKSIMQILNTNYINVDTY